MTRMSIQPPHASRQKTYLIYAWVGALVGLVLALQLPPSLQRIYFSTPRLVEGLCLLTAAVCLLAGLAKWTGHEKVICGFYTLLGLISTCLTGSLVA
jgi:hypothetical protein